MGEVGKALKAFSASNMKTLIVEEGGEEWAPKRERLATAHRNCASEDGACGYRQHSSRE